MEEIGDKVGVVSPMAVCFVVEVPGVLVCVDGKQVLESMYDARG